MGSNKNKKRGWDRGRSVFVIVGIMVLLAIGFYSVRRLLVSPLKPTAARPELSALNRAATSLVGPRDHYDALGRAALMVRDLINKGHFKQATQIVGGVLVASHRDGWDFSPFSQFIADVPEPGNTFFRQRLTNWIAQDPRSATPYLLRCLYDYDTAWATRGGGFVNHILPHNRARFVKEIGQAAIESAAAIDRAPQNPYPRYLALKILKAQGNAQGMRTAFYRSIRRFPTYYPLYAARLGALEPKWGGSLAAMRAFVARYAGHAAPTSPLRMLYLQLYAEFLGTATMACPTDPKMHKLCTAYVLSRLITPTLQRRARALLTVNGQAAPLTFVLTAGHILDDMIYQDPTGASVGPLLQTFASALGADDALVTGHDRHHNFMIDKLAAMVWYNQNQFHNAKLLLRRAIADLSHTQFPNRAARAQVRGGLYGDLAYVYSYTHHYRHVIIYQRAADLLTGRDSSNIECATLFKLRYYKADIKACTRQIHNADNGQAFYWRARSYQITGQILKALRDYRHVADSQSAFRASSAINISAIYGSENHLHRMLQALNRYNYLYKPGFTHKEAIAMAYNNRCYAEMNLGLLHRALADCTASLHFGNLPDAYAKQQEIMHDLKTRQAAAKRLRSA